MLVFPVLGKAGWLVALLIAGVPAYGSLCVPGAALLSAGADRQQLHQAVAAGLGNLAWSGGEAVAAIGAGAAAQAASDTAPAVLLCGVFLLTLVAVTALKEPAAASEKGKTESTLGRFTPGVDGLPRTPQGSALPPSAEPPAW
jgi:hypothetical protein